MTITQMDEIGGILTAQWPQLRVASEPEPLRGGFWAQMWKVHISGQPDPMPADVVVRFAPHPEMGAKEAEVQRAVAALGFRTPRVWLSTAATPPEQGWWSVMDFATGGPLLAGLEGAAVVRRAPSLVRQLPVQLGGIMAALHQLDPHPVTDAVRRAAPSIAWTVPEVTAQLRAGAEVLGRADVAAALDRLADGAPESVAPVICHGDLHPFNVLADADGLTVLDWTGAILGDPCFDIALTELLLANPPLPLPRPLTPVVRAAGRLLARRFIAAYHRSNPSVPLNGIPWFRALHSARVLLDVTRLRDEHGLDAGGHPWRYVTPAAARNLMASTGLEVRP